jgi:hypothetical protein
VTDQSLLPKKKKKTSALETKAFLVIVKDVTNLNEGMSMTLEWKKRLQSLKQRIMGSSDACFKCLSRRSSREHRFRVSIHDQRQLVCLYPLGEMITKVWRQYILARSSCKQATDQWAGYIGREVLVPCTAADTEDVVFSMFITDLNVHIRSRVDAGLEAL